ncbi:MAG: hypothetical protein IT374_07250 [Polyangiaceae bacterium]|nr:hypothetical protein [Polyangiaceae bacterium]
MTAWLLSLAAALALSAASCGGGATYDGVRYRADDLAFRAGPVPASWRRLETSHGRLAFRDDAAAATVIVNGRCGKDGDDTPLAALTNHLFLQFTEREVESEQTVPFDGREAQKTVLTAKLDGVQFRFFAVVLKKDGCVYDLVLMAEPSTFDAARGPFERFVSTFSGEGAP